MSVASAPDLASSPLLEIARASIEAHLRGEPYRPEQLPPPLDASRGVFVTIRDAQGNLRGCIGHIEPVHATLADEVRDCALAAAINDHRFPAMTARDWEGCTLEVSLLSVPRPAPDLTALDPKVDGIIVSYGSRRGLLLPDIPGVDTVEEQIGICLRKGRISPDDPWSVERFVVDKVSEVDSRRAP